MCHRVDVVDPISLTTHEATGDSRLAESGADGHFARVVNPDLDHLEDCSWQ